MPNKIKINLEKGKMDENEWYTQKKWSSLINDCTHIEKDINEISIIYEKIKASHSNIELQIKFRPELEKLGEFLENIKNFGEIYYIDKKKNIIHKAVQNNIEVKNKELNKGNFNLK